MSLGQDIPPEPKMASEDVMDLDVDVPASSAVHGRPPPPGVLLLGTHLLPFIEVFHFEPVPLLYPRFLPGCFFFFFF